MVRVLSLLAGVVAAALLAHPASAKRGADDIDGHLPSDVRTWSKGDVFEWVSTAGFSDIPKAQQAVVKNEVTGSVLLIVDDDDLQDEFGVDSGLERKRILAAITALADTAAEKPRTSGGLSAEEGGSGHALTFWE